MRAAQTIGTTVPRQQSLRHSDEDWVLRLRLQRSVLGREVGVVEGLGSSVPWGAELSIIAEETWEDVWACRRSKVPLLQRSKGGGVDCHQNIFPCPHAQTQSGRGAFGAGYKWQGTTSPVTGDRTHLVWATGGQVTLT